MFHYYNFNRDEFLAHYHKRRNVESTFSMIKAKFGDSPAEQDGHGDGQRGAVQDALPQRLLPDSDRTMNLGIEAKFWGKEEPREVARQPTPITTADTVEMWNWI